MMGTRLRFGNRHSARIGAGNLPGRAARRQKSPRHIHALGLSGRGPADCRQLHHMWSIITCPKPEQLTCVAPSSRRAKS